MKNDPYPSFHFNTQIFLNKVKILLIQVVVKICKKNKSQLEDTTSRPNSLH